MTSVKEKPTTNSRARLAGPVAGALAVLIAGTLPAGCSLKSSIGLGGKKSPLSSKSGDSSSSDSQRHTRTHSNQKMSPDERRREEHRAEAERVHDEKAAERARRRNMPARGATPREPTRNRSTPSRNSRGRAADDVDESYLAQSAELKKSMKDLSYRIDWLYTSRSSVNDIERLTVQTKDCTKLVAQARNSGATATTIAYTQYPNLGNENKHARINGSSAYPVEFRVLEKVCTEKSMLAKALPALSEFESAANYLARIESGSLEFDASNAGGYVTKADECMKVANKAMADGVPGSYALSVGKIKTTLSTGRQQFCDKFKQQAVAAKVKIDAAIAAQQKATVGPFRKVLKGDKLEYALLWEIWSDDTQVLGKGGYRLVTPRDFKKAKLWFTVGDGYDKHGRVIWTMSRYKFRGNKLVRESEKSGRGSSPPNRAFR